MSSKTKIIKAVSVVFSIIMLIPAFMVPMDSVSNLVMKFALFVYVSMPFWAGMRIWSKATMVLFSVFSTWEIFLVLREIQSDSDYWYNYIMHGRKGIYHGFQGTDASLSGLLTNAVVGILAGVMAILGLLANLWLSKSPKTLEVSTVSGGFPISPEVEKWRRFLSSLDHASQTSELKKLEAENPEFHAEVVNSLQG